MQGLIIYNPTLMIDERNTTLWDLQWLTCTKMSFIGISIITNHSLVFISFFLLLILQIIKVTSNSLMLPSRPTSHKMNHLTNYDTFWPLVKFWILFIHISSLTPYPSSHFIFRRGSGEPTCKVNCLCYQKQKKLLEWGQYIACIY